MAYESFSSLVHNNRNKNLDIRYSLLVNSFMNSVLLYFHSWGIFSIKKYSHAYIPNVRPCSLRSPRLHQIESWTLYSEHPVICPKLRIDETKRSTPIIEALLFSFVQWCFLLSFRRINPSWILSPSCEIW